MVELLIALVLLGLILLVLFSGMRLGTRSWDNADSYAENLDLARVLERFLRSEMSQVVPFRWQKSQKIAFSGERQSMKFAAPLPSRLGTEGVDLIALDIESTGNGSRIVWRYRLLQPNAEDFSSLDEVPGHVLVDGITSTRVSDVWFSYFGAENPGEEKHWVERWDGQNGLPLLIRVQAKLTEGREWPDFVVAPALAR